MSENPGESLNNRHDLDYEDYCNVKQGYLSVVTSDEISKEYKGKVVLKLKPVFAVLNKETLSLFENENVKSLYKSYNMRMIQPNNIPKGWDSVHCWQVIKGGGSTEDQKLEDAKTEGAQIDDQNTLVNLCATNSLEMQQWTKAI